MTTPSFTTNTLELAFSLHIADLILGAGEGRNAQEQAFMDRTFPLERSVEAGLMDATGGRTDRYDEAAMAALDVLPEALDDEAKCRLLGVFVQAVKADGVVDAAEARVFVDSGRLLELPDPVLSQWLEREFQLDLASLSEEDESQPE